MHPSLTQGFTRFLHRRRARRCFVRHPLLDTLATARLARDGSNEIRHEPPLPGVFFVWGAGILVGDLALTTVVKRVYIRRHGWQ